MQLAEGICVDAEQEVVRAEALLELRDVSHAVELFDRAEALGAGADRCSAGRWMGYMLRGDFSSAWRECDSIRIRGAPDPHRFWNGEAIDGRRAIVRCLHGFGDAVQMLRYAPALRARCAELIVEVPPRLLDLARCFDGVDRVITWGDNAPARAPEWDVQIEVMELPYLFRTEIGQLPLATTYLRVSDSALVDAGLRLGPHKLPRVGIVWAAGEWNRTRSILFGYAQEIVQAAGCEFWNLQGGPEAEVWSELPRRPALRDARECGDGIMPLAGVIQQLDLVITVDTLAAHLAGALGTPAWVLLQHAADWRWMIDRADTPWYPSLRLYRQPRQGEWDHVVRRVIADLRVWLASDRSEPAR